MRAQRRFASVPRTRRLALAAALLAPAALALTGPAVSAGAATVSPTGTPTSTLTPTGSVTTSTSPATVTTTTSPAATTTSTTPRPTTTTPVTTTTTPAPTAQVLVSAKADRSTPTALSGTTLTGTTYVFVSVATASKVEFWVDTTSTSGTPVTTRTSAPWDFYGSSTAAAAGGFDTRLVSNAKHTLLARVTQAGGSSQLVSASFTVNNPKPTPTTTTTTPPSATMSCRVDAAVWPGGYVLNLTLTDNGPSPVSAWSARVAFTQAPAVSNSWNATLATQATTVIATNLASNGTLKAGESVGIGFQGSWSGTWTAPTCTVTGTAYSPDAVVRSTCDNGGSIPVGTFWALNNLWGAGTGTGSQCVTARGLGADTLAWTTTWKWSGQNTKVKSYVAAIKGWHWGYPVAGSGLPLKVSSIQAIPARWQYDLTLDLSTFQQVNVAYDIWTGTTTNPGSPADEIMVWNFRTGGIQPVGSPQTKVTIDGVQWEIWKGAHTWNVMTYVRLTPQADDDLQLDLKHFTDDLVARKWLDPAKYVVGIESGSEVFYGNGGLDTTLYQVSPR